MFFFLLKIGKPLCFPLFLYDYEVQIIKLGLHNEARYRSTLPLISAQKTVNWRIPDKLRWYTSTYSV